MVLSPYRMAGLLAFLTATVALAVAHGSEIWGGLVPCALCLWERWPWRVAGILGLAAALTPPGLARFALALLVIAALVSAAVSAIHTGVEFKWWPSPLPECAAVLVKGGSVAERLARMPATPAKPCDDPTFLIPGLPVSMAMMNLLASLACAAGIARAATRRHPA